MLTNKSKTQNWLMTEPGLEISTLLSSNLIIFPVYHIVLPSVSTFFLKIKNILGPNQQFLCFYYILFLSLIKNSSYHRLL